MTLPAPYYHDERCGITLYCGDCLELLPLFEAGSVDAVVTDPPYGCRKAEWDEDFFGEWFPLVREWDVPVVCLTGSCGVADSLRLFGEAFIDVISLRNLNGMTRGPIGFGNWLAAAVGVAKPRMGWNATDFVVNEPMPDHPSPKPIEAMVKLVSRLTDDGEMILDNCAGSGTTLVAAKRLGRRAIGIEISEHYCEIAANRLRNEPAPLFAESRDSNPRQLELVTSEDER